MVLVESEPDEYRLRAAEAMKKMFDSTGLKVIPTETLSIPTEEPKPTTETPATTQPSQANEMQSDAQITQP